MKCIKCNSIIPQGRVNLGYKVCVNCSTTEAYGCAPLINHKTGNSIQIMSSCGIQFGNYERWKEIHRGVTCEVDERDYEFTSAYNNCENCDEID